MSVIVFIPVRGGSKSIPNKNILLLNGKPLVQYVIEAGVNSQKVDRVIVATDSNLIEEVVLSLKLPKVEIYRRLDLNAQDNSTTESVVLEYFNSDCFNLNDTDTFILVQATSPQCSKEDIDGSLKLFESNKYDSILSGVKFNRFMWDSLGNALNYDYKKRPRRQDITTSYYIENGAIYISKVRDFKKHENRLNGLIGVYGMNDDSLIELDEPSDIPVIEMALKKVGKTDINSIKKIKLFISDIDGTLTDSGMYYDKNGESFKKFNTKDGFGFRLLKENNILTGVITSETSPITRSRFINKLNLDFVIEGVSGIEKLVSVRNICNKLGINLDEVAYIGDDLNCIEILKAVGLRACPSDANKNIKTIPDIIVSRNRGGEGCVRDFADYILENH